MDTKTKMKIKRFGKMCPIFEIFITKLGHIKIFMKVWEKKIDSSLNNRGKMKMKMEKFRKMSLIFKLSILKLGYMTVFFKICFKIFDLFFRTFLTNWGKNEDEDEKILENVFNF